MTSVEKAEQDFAHHDILALAGSLYELCQGSGMKLDEQYAALGIARDLVSVRETLLRGAAIEDAKS